MKIDLEGLKHDLKKFEEHYPKEAATFWSHWVSKVDELLSFPDEWEWPPKIRPSSADCTVPDSLQALQDKARNPTRQVCTTFKRENV